MNGLSPLAALSELLADRSKPIIDSDRLAPSASYDLQYRMFVVAAAFQIHARDTDRGRRIQAAKLKLLQFVAARPWLLPTVRRWSESRRDAQLSLLSSQRLRRGFLSDTMHDELIAFLVAREILVRDRSHLTLGEAGGVLGDMYDLGIEQDWFSAERDVLAAMKRVMVTNDMLGGE